MIAGLEEISSGELKIGDKVVNDVEPKDRDIAMVFQNYALYPHMTVYDNMAFGLKLRKVPKDEIDKMVREAAKILDLEALLDLSLIHIFLENSFFISGYQGSEMFQGRQYSSDFFRVSSRSESSLQNDS